MQGTERSGQRGIAVIVRRPLKASRGQHHRPAFGQAFCDYFTIIIITITGFSSVRRSTVNNMWLANVHVAVEKPQNSASCDTCQMIIKNLFQKKKKSLTVVFQNFKNGSLLTIWEFIHTSNSVNASAQQFYFKSFNSSSVGRRSASFLKDMLCKKFAPLLILLFTVKCRPLYFTVAVKIITGKMVKTWKKFMCCSPRDFVAWSCCRRICRNSFAKFS